MNIFNRKAVNLSNFLSVSRIFLAFIIIELLRRNYNIWVIFTVTFVTALTDVLDGYFARKLNQVTELGKILDPVADKLAIISVGIALVYFRNFPYWLLIIIGTRDIILSFIGLLTIGKFKKVTSSNSAGKLQVAVLTVLIFSYVLNFKPVQIYLLIISLILIIYSFIIYCISYYRLFRSHFISKQRSKK